MSTLSIQVSRKFPSRVDVSKDQRVDVVRLANYANELSGKLLEILKKLSCQKLVCEEKQLLQDPGYVDTVDTCCMLHAMRQGAILIVFTMYVDTVDTIELQCRF